MPHFLVHIHGDAHRAAGLLAVAGIQNLIAEEGVIARLSAKDGESAVERVRAALADEPFTVAGVRLEPELPL